MSYEQVDGRKYEGDENGWVVTPAKAYNYKVEFDSDDCIHTMEVSRISGRTSRFHLFSAKNLLLTNTAYGSTQQVTAH